MLQEPSPSRGMLNKIATQNRGIFPKVNTRRLESLPINSVLPDIVLRLKSAGAVVLRAEPGAGKTMRVPPAILDAGLADLESGGAGQIVVLQPRRIAARSAAARISDERGTVLGEEIGYRVRLEGKSSARTRILVCTEGVFLRRLQDDPLLEDVAVVVFDEFHERSLDGDLALAMITQVRSQVRPDLRIVVMSATLDSAPIADYLGGCPIVECPGRTYPVEIEYLQFAPNTPLPRLAVEGVSKFVGRDDAPGHVLVFLPGVGEIRKTEEILHDELAVSDRLVLPLYGDMSLEEQQQVLRPSKQSKIILATNVAETSLTIDGVTAVVDTGMARVNRFHPQLGLNRLELERISKASAAQRAGRAGRTAAGRCLRLWTERDHLALRDFDAPEIARVELSQCLLQLIAWGEYDVKAFPFFEAPPEAAVDKALQLLDLLDAISAGRITSLGKQMARLPLQPRLARLMIEASEAGYAERGALCAALLSERDPIRRERNIDGAPRHRTDSDVLDRLTAAGGTKQIMRAAKQLVQIIGTAGSGTSSTSEDEALRRALLVAFPDRVCKRRQPNDRRAVMVGRRGVKVAEESAVIDGDLFVAVELSDSGQSETLVRQASLIERNWLPPTHVTSSVEVAYDVQRQKVVAFKRNKYVDLILDEMPAPMPADVDPGAMLAQGILANLDLNSLIDEEAKRYFARVQSLRECLPELNVPDFGESPWQDLLPDWCSGCSSVSELRGETLIACIQARLTREQVVAIESEVPDRFKLPSGRTVKIEYEIGKPAIIAVRIQELFGQAETPKLARGRVPVLLHLLAPNYRVQQITPDLASFWKNTYPTVKKELKQRYPKHAWPENPLAPISS